MRLNKKIFNLLLAGICLSTASFQLSAQNGFRSIRMNPLSFINGIHGANANVSYEHSLKSPAFSAIYTVGVHLPYRFLGWENLNGAFGRIELRNYDSRGYFIGLEFSGGYQSYYTTDSLECSGCSSARYFSKRSWLELNGNIGAVELYEKGYFFEVYFSVGVRFYNNVVGLSQELAESRYFGDWTVPRHYREKSGVNWAPKITMNVRLGRRLKPRD